MMHFVRLLFVRAQAISTRVIISIKLLILLFSPLPGFSKDPEFYLTSYTYWFLFFMHYTVVYKARVSWFLFYLILSYFIIYIYIYVSYLCAIDLSTLLHSLSTLLFQVPGLYINRWSIESRFMWLMWIISLSYSLAVFELM